MVDSQLESWVEQKIQEGLSLNQIEQQLRQQGWDDRSIQEAEKLAQQRLGGSQGNASLQNNQNAKSESSNLKQRAGALIIDSLLQVLLLGVWVAGSTGFAAISGFGIPHMLDIFAVLTVPLGYFILFEGRSGSTPGKKVLDLKVVKHDGSLIGYRESAIRNTLRIVDGLALYLVGVIAVTFTDNSQRIGDLAAGTVVTRT